MDEELQWRKLELKRLRWKLQSGLYQCDPEVLPAAVDWLNGEISRIDNEKQLLAG
ncbi:hypothetical protein [Paenibacillus selenitireducens]|uniref:hypothetical protein n=1 Tax=Paenibacillus selenitireducens TaxID=1324314 RepID=UPI001301C60B|nr:hypothetical protein [Paenibacillus selenitireducens]